MEECLADDGGMALVEVPLLHLLELFSEEVVHEGGQLRCTLSLAEFFTGLEFIEAGVRVEDEFVEVFHAILTHIALHI